MAQRQVRGSAGLLPCEAPASGGGGSRSSPWSRSGPTTPILSREGPQPWSCPRPHQPFPTHVSPQPRGPPETPRKELGDSLTPPPRADPLERLPQGPTWGSTCPPSLAGAPSAGVLEQRGCRGGAWSRPDIWGGYMGGGGVWAAGQGCRQHPPHRPPWECPPGGHIMTLFPPRAPMGARPEVLGSSVPLWGVGCRGVLSLPSPAGGETRPQMGVSAPPIAEHEFSRCLPPRFKWGPRVGCVGGTGAGGGAPLPKACICFHGNAGCEGSRPLAAADVTAGRGPP